MTPEARLVAKIAGESTERILRSVVLDLQRMKDSLLSGGDSGLASTWDEICVQAREGESFYWDAYEETIRAFIQESLKKVSENELQAMWLQTDAGFDWRWDHDEDVGEIPWDLHDVVGYVMEELFQLAGRWSNRRIRGFLERQ